MDKHYDMVMGARAQADATPRLYFGYSTILDAEAFAAWRQQHGYEFFSLPEGKLAEALDVELVFDFPSRFWGGRVAGLTDTPGRTVFGRLYEIPGKDWPVIQHKEGAVTGMCIERQVRVRCDGQELTATAFVTAPQRRSSEGPVSAPFVEALARGMRGAGLPAEYVARVEQAARG